MLTLGEVHTGLLQHSTSVPQELTVEILETILGERVRQSERPIPYAVSPDRLTGVDCPLATRSGARTRGIGTVVSRTAITGGHVVQGSAFTSVAPSAHQRRLAWSHYLSRRGHVEVIGKADEADLVLGFAAPTAPPDSLDLGGISERALSTSLRSTKLDRRPPFVTTRTRFRWIAREPVAGEGPVTLTLERDALRTLTIRMPTHDPAMIAELCEDLARHDWLLTTLLGIVERALNWPGSRFDRVARLGPAIDNLLHLWMPAARVDSAVLPVWTSIDERPGLTRQWERAVNRIRDQVSLSVVSLLGTTAGGKVHEP